MYFLKECVFVRRFRWEGPAPLTAGRRLPWGRSPLLKVRHKRFDQMLSNVQRKNLCYEFLGGGGGGGTPIYSDTLVYWPSQSECCIDIRPMQLNPAMSNSVI